MFTDYRGQILGRFNAQLFIDIVPAEHDFNITDRHAELFCQEPDHMIGCPARHRRGSSADFELLAFGLADGILFCAGLAKDIKHQRFAIPGAEGINCQSFAFHNFI
jgi:hypothetical protein